MQFVSQQVVAGNQCILKLKLQQGDLDNLVYEFLERFTKELFLDLAFEVLLQFYQLTNFLNDRLLD